jgi:surfeit locus 1 family protein
MKPRTAIGALLVLAVAATCVRLGFWQLARLEEKRAANASLAAAMSAPPILVSGPTKESVVNRRVSVRGSYDESIYVVLVARAHDGAPGVELVTPLVIEGESTAVLVDRGWIYAADAATAAPRTVAEPGVHDVVGIAESMRHGAGGAPLRVTPDSGVVYSARWLDLDSLQARVPWRLLPFALRQLPGPGVPDRPLRRPPQPMSEFTHVSYAIQWFLFAAILLVGSIFLARSRRRSGA